MMDLGGASVSGPRPYNEDNYHFVDLSGHSASLAGLTAFAIVCDGMGGHQSGDVASRVAIEAARGYVEDLVAMSQRSAIELDVGQALREITSEAHDAVMAAAAERGGSSMGSTLVATFVSDREAWVGHVGDSRAYLLREGGAKPLTVDHSQVGRMIAEGILTEEQAQHHPQRNVIERALGFDGSSAEITHVRIRSGDAIILCSDGLSTVLSGDDIAALSLQARSAEDAARALTDGAAQAGTDDNTTAVIVCDDWRLAQAGAPQRTRSRRDASRARREAQRHKRASRASIVFGGIALVAVAAIAFAAVMGSRPTGGGTGATTVTASTVTSAAAPAAAVAGSDEPTDTLVPSEVFVDPKATGGVWLRSEPNARRGNLVRLKPGAALRPAGLTEQGDFYIFNAGDVQDELIELTGASVSEAWRSDHPKVYGWADSFLLKRPGD